MCNSRLASEDERCTSCGYTPPSARCAACEAPLENKSECALCGWVLTRPIAAPALRDAIAAGAHPRPLAQSDERFVPVDAECEQAPLGLGAEQDALLRLAEGVKVVYRRYISDQSHTDRCAACRETSHKARLACWLSH